MKNIIVILLLLQLYLVYTNISSERFESTGKMSKVTSSIIYLLGTLTGIATPFITECRPRGRLNPILKWNFLLAVLQLSQANQEYLEKPPTNLRAHTWQRVNPFGQSISPNCSREYLPWHLHRWSLESSFVYLTSKQVVQRANSFFS